MEVPHVHLHVVSIDAESQLNFANADPSTAPEALDDAAARILSALVDLGHANPAG
jgi:hypothetical protein